MLVEEYDAILVKQGGVCAICARIPLPDKLLHVDHDHGTGVVRGLLCQQCNHAIGLLGDNPSTLRAAVQYLSVKV